MSWRGGGGVGWGGVRNFQCRPIDPVILFYLIDCRKRKQFIHEDVTRCVTRYMGNRNNSDGKTSLKR